ncbi:MAG: hypothetical protein QHJ82_04180 [Verrucomicrobiota bacterium]|nr:hypothetical protein [Verrucomicrobiota bacterium]
MKPADVCCGAIDTFGTEFRQFRMRAGCTAGFADALDPRMVGFSAHPAHTTVSIMVGLA